MPSPYVGGVYQFNQMGQNGPAGQLSGPTQLSALPGIARTVMGGRGQAGGGWGGGGGGEMQAGGGYPGFDIRGLLGMQGGENEWARRNNQASWDLGRNTLLGVQQNYNQDPTVAATRNRVQQLLADPEAINDRVQSMIQNRAANQINAQQAAQGRDVAGILAAGGQMDAGSMAAAAERIGNAGMAQQTNIGSQLEIQRANQRNQDIQNAIAAGRGMSGQDYGLQMDVAGTLIRNLPQYQPQDLSGWLAAMPQGGGGMGGGGGGGMYAGGGAPGGGWSGWQGGVLGGAGGTRRSQAPNVGSMTGLGGNVGFGGPTSSNWQGYPTQAGPDQTYMQQSGMQQGPPQGMFNPGGLTQNPYAAAMQQQANQQQANQQQAVTPQQTQSVANFLNSPYQTPGANAVPNIMQNYPNQYAGPDYGQLSQYSGPNYGGYTY